MVGLKEFRGLFQPKQFLDSLIHGGGLGHGAAQKLSKWQGHHVSLGPCYSEYQAPGLELPSSRRIKTEFLELAGASQEAEGWL